MAGVAGRHCLPDSVARLATSRALRYHTRVLAAASRRRADRRRAVPLRRRHSSDRRCKHADQNTRSILLSVCTYIRGAAGCWHRQSAIRCCVLITARTAAACCRQKHLVSPFSVGSTLSLTCGPTSALRITEPHTQRIPEIVGTVPVGSVLYFPMERRKRFVLRLAT